MVKRTKTAIVTSWVLVLSLIISLGLGFNSVEIYATAGPGQGSINIAADVESFNDENCML